MIQITKIDETTYNVTVNGKETSSHKVDVRHEYALKLTAGKVNIETLIEKSFEFLLARESNTSILRNFDLSVISRYFPEYENEIKRMLN